MTDTLHIDEGLTYEVDPDAEHPTVTVLAEEDDLSGWAARLTGLDPAHGYARLFLAEQSHTPGPTEGLVFKRYALRRDGLYQIDTPRFAQAEHVFVRRAGPRLERVDEAHVQARLRGDSPMTMLDVEVACMHGLWEDARRAALHLEPEGERQRAALYIEEARGARGESGWAQLEGSDHQRRWANVIRARAAAQLTTLHDECFVRLRDLQHAGQEPPHALLDTLTAIAQASARLHSEREAAFYIRQRHQLEGDDEHLLFALISGE